MRPAFAALTPAVSDAASSKDTRPQTSGCGHGPGTLAPGAKTLFENMLWTPCAEALDLNLSVPRLPVAGLGMP